MRGSLDELRGFADWVRELGFRDAVLLGMGGSSLAPDVFQRTFGAAPGFPTLHVLDTTDPLAIVRVENRVDVHSTLCASRWATSRRPTCNCWWTTLRRRCARPQRGNDSLQGCDYLKGHLVGEPMPANEFEAPLEAGARVGIPQRNTLRDVRRPA